MTALSQPAARATELPRSAGSPFRLGLLLTALASLGAFALEGFEVLTHPLSGLDVGIERAVQGAYWGPLVAAFGAVDFLEGLKQVALAAIGLVVVFLLHRKGFLLMAWGALSGGAYTLLQMFIHRPRPSANLVHVLRHTNGYSFPSGHAVFFVWFLSYLILILGRRYLSRPLYIAAWVLMAVVVAIVCIGRLYIAEHWPSDVLAGLLLGAGWSFLGLSVSRLSDPVLHA